MLFMEKKAPLLGWMALQVAILVELKRSNLKGTEWETSRRIKLYTEILSKPLKIYVVYENPSLNFVKQAKSGLWSCDDIIQKRVFLINF